MSKNSRSEHPPESGVSVVNLPLIDTPQKFAAAFDVSRETVARLEVYEKLLRQWQKGTNLVSPATLDQIWHRHFADSAQLLRFAPETAQWLDLGTGAGFPGLVVAVCRANRDTGTVHVIESNARKCAFVHEVVRETGCSVEIHQTRVESLWGNDRLTGVDCVTARALAPLPSLLELSAPFFGPNTRGLFLKGHQAKAELENASENWRFRAESHPSVTRADAWIVEISDLRRRESDNVEGAKA
ncbi:MAG: 16S rRNA (guanine(527)-N(7))-methyltransferase RsmG [Pseudomonadota bacterium]